MPKKGDFLPAPEKSTCTRCGVAFTMSRNQRYHYRLGRRKFSCSPAHSNEMLPSPQKATCWLCKKEFELPAVQRVNYRKGQRKFYCCRQHSSIGNAKEISETLRSKCSAKPTTYRKLHGKKEHRGVAEKLIGRKLLAGEIVHHIDENIHNNDSANLQVMTRAEHIRLHRPHHKNAAKCREGSDE